MKREIDSERRVRVVRSSLQKTPEVRTLNLRQEAGCWLKRLRLARGLSQRDLAKKVGIEYYTFISQLETGRGRIPPDRYLLWADALGVTPRGFVAELMRYYDPVTFEVLFG